MRAIKAIHLRVDNFIEVAKYKMMDARSSLIFQSQSRGINEYPSVFGIVWTIQVKSHELNFRPLDFILKKVRIFTLRNLHLSVQELLLHSQIEGA